MRYRTKLTLSFLLLAAATGGVVLGLYYFQSRAMLFEQIQSKTLVAAATGALLIDGDLHETLRSPADESGETYRQMQAALRRVRDANHRDDIKVRFVYTMRPDPAAADQWLYVVDAEENEGNHSHIGDPVSFDSDDKRPLRLDRAYAEQAFSRDRFGYWLSANAPIADSRGRHVALLGVDLSANRVTAQMHSLLMKGVTVTALALVVAVMVGFALSHHATRPLEKIRLGIEAIARGELDTKVEVRGRDEFRSVAEAVNGAAVALRERAMLKGALVRYVSRDVAEEILREQSLPALRGERRDITVLMCDIRDFTAMADTLPPEEVVTFLNAYFERMIEVIFAHRGTLDKFLGDGLMAVFGAPLQDPQHAAHGLEAALAMLEGTRIFNDRLVEKRGAELRVGIAVHSGAAVVGNIGSEQRMEYTAIGDAVNVASRVEAMNKVFGTDLLVTDAVVERIGSLAGLQKVEEVSVRGVNRRLTLYTGVDSGKRADAVVAGVS